MASVRYLAIAFVLLPLAGAARAEPAAPAWPRITEARDANACRQALVVATLAFKSPATKLADAAPAILSGKQPGSGILLAPDGGHAEGDGFIVDASAIELKEAPNGELKAVLLQRAAVNGARFVVTQQKMNWQGDWYGLYVAYAKLDADKLADALADEKQTIAKPVFTRAWQRPWLVRDPQSGEIVGIDTQHPVGFLDDWIVYKLVGAAAAVACHIAFRPAAEHATDLLPAGSLREFATLLDAIVGVPAQDEGTLQPTARIRVAAATAWANALLRPWAMAEPYNSAAEIADGLEAWSRKSAAYAAQYRRMQALYPDVLRVLAAHYQAALGKPPAEAAALAKESLDRAVGTHFVFPKKG